MGCLPRSPGRDGRPRVSQPHISFQHLLIGLVLLERGRLNIWPGMMDGQDPSVPWKGWAPARESASRFFSAPTNWPRSFGTGPFKHLAWNDGRTRSLGPLEGMGARA